MHEVCRSAGNAHWILPRRCSPRTVPRSGPSRRLRGLWPPGGSARRGRGSARPHARCPRGAAMMTPPLSAAIVFALLLLAPLALAGLALVNAGLGRSRSAAQSLLGSLAIMAAAFIAFAGVGACFAGPDGALSFNLAGKSWNWLGTAPVLLLHLARSPIESQLGVLFECLAAALVSIIPWGAGADRLRLAAGWAIAALMGALGFPVLAHWVWGAGWIGQLGANFGLGAGFLDPAGGATVHVLGGAGALAVVWIAGPRRGKFPKEGLATAMPAHNATFVLAGCMIAVVGWLAFNCAGALLWLHADLNGLVITALNTLLAAAGALGATLVVTWIRFGKPDASLCANGWLAGLVTSSASAALIPPAAALFTGVVMGIATPLLVEFLELALSIDDPAGAISVHFAGGLWGVFVAGVFAPQKGQLLAQLAGMAAVVGVFLPTVYFAFKLLDRFIPLRVDPDGERIGMDLHELGGGAYPEFVIHRDESYR
ncbi:ammonium transporter [Acidobacteria bacterium AB60]|nr:ammonium transporter [Acidobacteria bacterium AB60]